MFILHKVVYFEKKNDDEDVHELIKHNRISIKLK